MHDQIMSIMGEIDSSRFDITAQAPGAAGRLPLTDDLLTCSACPRMSEWAGSLGN